MFQFATSCIHQLAHTGAGWYHMCVAEHLLHFGIIIWDDISHSVEAKRHLPAIISAKPLAMMQEAWQGEEL